MSKPVTITIGAHNHLKDDRVSSNFHIGQRIGIGDKDFPFGKQGVKNRRMIFRLKRIEFAPHFKVIDMKNDPDNLETTLTVKFKTVKEQGFTFHIPNKSFDD